MKIKNIRDVEILMCNTLESMTADEDSLKHAREVANLSGKLLKAQCVSMAWGEVSGKKQTLPFMERNESGE